MSMNPPFDERERPSLKRWLFRNMLRRTTIVLTGLLLLQFALWIEAEKLWPPGAFALALYTLLLTAVTEFWTRLHGALRGALEVVLIGLMHWIALGTHPALSGTEDAWGRLGAYFASFFPELAVSLAVWAVYLAALWWVRTKARIYILLLVSVIALAVRDSFSVLILWDQEALIIFCGIGLLIVRHFSSLKQKDPDSWTYLAEYPGAVALPIALLISITAVIGVSVPELPPLVTDPYTAWKQWKGESVAPAGKGFGDYTITPLDSTSGYSRNDEDLGGGFNYDYAEIMSVDTTQRSYWRGETKSYYTGKGWDFRSGDQPDNLPIDRLETSLPQDARVNASKLKTVEVTQTFTLLNDQQYPVLFGASYMDKVTGMTDPSGTSGLPRPSPLLWLRDRSELYWYWPAMQKKMYPKQYTVISRMPVLDEQGLRAANPAAYSRPEWRDYLQLPDTLPARVRQLALDITKDATNPYDKVKALETYLSTTYKYNNKPDLSKGKSNDFVDRFLFEIKEGYCDYYSTSMVVMTRSLGIPARWVKGFTTGTLPQDEIDMGMGMPDEPPDPIGAGTYTVRNADAHSWAEVYFDGYGWIPFEPTAGFAIPFAEPPAEPDLTPLAPTADTPASDPASTHRIWPALRIGIAAVLLAAALLLLWKFGLLRRLSLRRGDTLNFNHRVIYEFERFLRYCRRKGYVRHDHETARETLQRWMDDDSGLRDDLAPLLAVFERAKYGKAPLSEGEWTRVSALLQKLRSQI